MTLVAFALGLEALSSTALAQSFVSNKLFLRPVCPIGEQYAGGDGAGRGAIAAALARVFAPRVVQRALKGAADGLRKLAGETDKQVTAEAAELYGFYQISYDNDRGELTTFLNEKMSCLVFVRGEFSDNEAKPTTEDARAFQPLADLSKTLGHASGALNAAVVEDEPTPEMNITEPGRVWQKKIFVYDGVPEDRKSDPAWSHAYFFRREFGLAGEPDFYFEASLSDAGEGYFRLSPRVLWYLSKIGNRRDDTRDLVIAVQFDDVHKATASSPGTFANAQLSLKDLKIGSLLGPAKLAGFSSPRLKLRDAPLDVTSESKWAKNLLAAKLKRDNAKTAIARGDKSLTILNGNFSEKPNTCDGLDVDEFSEIASLGSDPAGDEPDSRIECLEALQATKDAKIEWISAESDETILPDCDGQVDSAKKSCELIREKYNLQRVQELQAGAIARLQEKRLQTAFDEARRQNGGSDSVGLTMLKVSITETRDSNAFLSALADIISPADDLQGLNSGDIQTIQTAILPLSPTASEQAQSATAQQEANRDYQLAQLMIEQKQRELKALKDGGRPQSEWVPVEAEIVRQKLQTNIAASKLGISPPYTDVLAPGVR
ncbi:MAG: hypothetical protein ACOZAA_06460 [Pseudomonadota bacterium]